MKKILIASVLAMAMTAPASVNAAMRMASPKQLGATSAIQVPMQAGILACIVHPGSDERHATCVFNHPAGENSFSETYGTKFTQVLARQGIRTGQTLRWAVFTPGGKANPGMLLGARPDNSVAETASGGARVEVSFQSDGQRITFKPIDGSSGAATKANLELVPSPEPVAMQSKKAVELTVIH